MTKVALALGVLTVLVLNVILASGNPAARGVVFDTAIEVLPFVMLPSSVLFALRFWKAGHRGWAGMFLLNVAAFLIVLGVLLSGGRPTEQVLFVADVLQLNLYLLALARHWRLLSSDPVP